MTKKIFCLMALAILFAGCSNDDGGGTCPKERKNIELSRSEQVMTEETTDFAFRFFQQVNQSETRLKVDEEGTEAAAVTIGGMVSSAAPPSTGPVPFHLNRPFVFTISGTSTGTILFMGKVTEF